MAEDEAHLEDRLLDRLRPALERWYRGDPYGYAELFGDRLTYFDPRARAPVSSPEELRDHYAPIEGAVNFPRWEVRDSHVQRMDDVAVLTYRLEQFDHEGRVPPRWNATEVYRRTGDGWQAVHAHWSTAPEEA